MSGWGFGVGVLSFHSSAFFGLAAVIVAPLYAIPATVLFVTGLGLCWGFG